MPRIQIGVEMVILCVHVVHVAAYCTGNHPRLYPKLWSVVYALVTKGVVRFHVPLTMYLDVYTSYQIIHELVQQHYTEQSSVTIKLKAG